MVKTILQAAIQRGQSAACAARTVCLLSVRGHRDFAETLHCLSLLFVSAKNAVPGQAVGHSVLCVNPLHKPLPGQGSATVRLWQRRQSHAERGRTNGTVQKHPVPCMGLSAYVPRDAYCDTEVSTNHITDRGRVVIRVICCVVQ